MKIFIYFLTILFVFLSCDRVADMGRERFRKKIAGGKPSEAEIEKWKERLALDEAEIHELDEKIKKLVHKTKMAGALSWKIAQAYMKVGSFELSTKYYNEALRENMREPTKNSEAELHSFESAIPFFEKALNYKDINDDLLFETGLAYANASRDRGWDIARRKIAIRIFQGIMRKSPEDTRAPYELALIYFDSSPDSDLAVSAGANPYDEREKALKIINLLLQKEPGTISYLFARANFLYRMGKTEEAEGEYLSIKSRLEKLKSEGLIREGLDQNNSYKNVLKNLKQIQETKK